jgi:hypothetical protein
MRVPRAGFNRSRFLTTTGHATLWTSFIAVYWNLADPFRYKILVATFVWMTPFWGPAVYKKNGGYDSLPGDDPGTGEDRLEDHQSQPDNARSDDTNPRDVFEKIHSKRGMSWKLFEVWIKYACQPGEKPYIFYGFQSAVFIFLAFACFVLLTIASILISKSVVAKDGKHTALWSSSNCGIWDFSDSLGDPYAIEHSLIDLNKEARAGEYVKRCYGSRDAFYSMRCSSFYRPAINVEKKSHAACAFDQSVCMEGQTSVSFDTGLVSSEDIGVNIGRPFKFRRRTSCSPLKQDGFITRAEKHGVPVFYYNYGEYRDYYGRYSNYTYATEGDPFHSAASGYEVK